MKETVNEYRFIEGFRECNREDNFSREGREAMYEYFTDMEHGEFEIEYDPIAICCEYTEYDNITAFNDAYGKDYEDFDALEEDGICFFLRFDVRDYFAEGASFMKPHVEEHIIVEDF